MILAGLSVVILGPYLMWHNMGPHKLSGAAAQEASDSEPEEIEIDPMIDVKELEKLPKSLHDGALALLTTDMPDYPDTIANLPEPTSDKLVSPVSEAVWDTQPTLFWQPSFGEPPYTVSVYLSTQELARGQNLENTSWTLPMPLPRGNNYTWQLTSGEASARATFRVLDEEQSKLWTATKIAYGTSHLVMGTTAEQFGMLSPAEREYAALVKDLPDSETAARLLSNVRQLRAR